MKMMLAQGASLDEDAELSALPTADVLEARFPTRHPRTLIRDILHRTLLGESPGEIADRLEMHPAVVGQITHSPLFQSELRRMQRSTEEKIVELKTRFLSMADRAVERLDELIESGNERIAQTTCFDILDRAGLGAVQKHENKNLDVAKVVELAWRKKQADAAVHGVIDASFSVSPQLP